MEYYKKHKKGIIGTLIFHVIILLLLIFLGFFTPLPLPGEEGILVNFGDSETGFGEREPRPASARSQPAPPVKQEEEVVPPPPSTPPQQAQPKPEPAKEVAMTQDYEETAALEAAEKKKREDERKRQEQIDKERRQKQLEDERTKKIEQERIRKQQEENDRIRREEAARKAREEAERKAKEEEQKKINEINSRAQGAFGESSTGTGGGNSDGKSQGATFPGGNQGVKTGDPNAGNYGQGGSGTGAQGTGISFSLSGRTANSLPKPNYPGDDEGLVVVKVTVDKYGKVTAAEPGARGTTIVNERFWNEARQAALKAKFNIDENAPAFQQGTISYRFVLD